jgi:hypothetical protein
MPSGIFPVPKLHPAPARTWPTLAVRIRARWRRNRLDEQLARGAAPAKTSELSLRAAQLRSRAERTRLANALVEAVGDARGPNLGAFTIKARRRHAEIRNYADALLALAARLRDHQPVDLRGAAMIALLVNDGASPLRRGGGQDLQREIRAARFALDATGASTQDLARAA